MDFAKEASLAMAHLVCVLLAAVFGAAVAVDAFSAAGLLP